MNWSELKIDTSRFEAMGMTILTAKDVEGMRSLRAKEWPEDHGFEPKGVSIEEAQIAMRKIR